MKQFFQCIWMILLTLPAFTLNAADSITVTGAGATFPYPLYSKWFYEYNKLHSDIKFNYQSIGSGGGIQQITAKTVDFGASDAPMKDEELAKVSGPLLHIPTILGAVVVSYHLPEVGSELKLTGSVLADIMLGKIKKWNDPKLQALNPGHTLPAQDIFVAYRSDGSGTTHVFTDYLAKVSPEFKVKVGAGKSVKWPVGLGGKGNEGVAGLVKQTPASLGYVELSYAVENKLAYASLQNKTGEFIAPSIESVSAAAAGELPEDYRASITDSTAKGAYPISAFTYLLLYQHQEKSAKGRALVEFLKWAMTDGQTLAPALHYAPLPAALVARVKKTIEQIKMTP